MSHSEIWKKIGIYFFLFGFLTTASAVRTIGQDVPARPNDFGKLADDYFSPLVANKKIRAAAVIVVDNQKTVFCKMLRSCRLRALAVAGGIGIQGPNGDWRHAARGTGQSRS